MVNTASGLHCDEMALPVVISWLADPQPVPSPTHCDEKAKTTPQADACPQGADIFYLLSNTYIKLTVKRQLQEIFSAQDFFMESGPPKEDRTKKLYKIGRRMDDDRI